MYPATTGRVLSGMGYQVDIDYELAQSGLGIDISVWNSAAPQPTVADIDAASYTAERAYAPVVAGTTSVAGVQSDAGRSASGRTTDHEPSSLNDMW